MVKQSSTNSAFFKTGGREAASRQELAHEREKPLSNQAPDDANVQGKEGQPNFIPGEAPVGEAGRPKPEKKN